MLVLIPVLAVLTALEGRLPDERDSVLGPLVGTAIGSPGGPRVGALAGGLLGDQLDKQHAAKAERYVVTVGSKTTVNAVGLVYGLDGTGSSPPAGELRATLEQNLRKCHAAIDVKKLLDDPETARRVTELIVDLARQARPSGKEPAPAPPAKPAATEPKGPVRTIYVPPFGNEAKDKGSSPLAADLTDAVIRAIGTRTPYKVVANAKNADTELLVTVTAVEACAASRDGEMIVTVELIWRDLRTGELLCAAGRAGNKVVPVRLRATAGWKPELGESIKTAHTSSCEKIAAQVVSALEKPWGDKRPEPGMPMGCGSIVPVRPWQAGRLDEKYKAADPGRVQILPPVREGFPNPIDCCDKPTDREVLAAVPAAAKGIPAVYTETRDNFRITKELESEKLDAPRFYPLVGPAQAHHGTWKCTVRFTETVASDYPFPVKVSRDRTEVVRVRTTHLHFTEPQTGPATRDLTTDPAPRP